MGERLFCLEANRFARIMPDMQNDASILSNSLADRLEDALPQTQCTKCGYAACRPYAEAMASGEASYNQCPPGGAEGVARLAAILGKPVIPLNPVHGVERPRPVAVIDEALCIGCTLCIQACPVDAIMGAAKQMHTVLPDLCTGCDLCVAPCPVDCIAMVDVTPGKTGWAAWSQQQADGARERHDFRSFRLQRERQENDARLAAKAAAKLKEVQAQPGGTAAEQSEQQRKKAIIQAAIARANAKLTAAQNGAEAAVSHTTSTGVADLTDPDKTPKSRGGET
ncbi:MAG: Ferredoxin [Herminiimonas sp.]|nr:Ferredoxin [Herminiimonas sp.]